MAEAGVCMMIEYSLFYVSHKRHSFGQSSFDEIIISLNSAAYTIMKINIFETMCHV